MTRVFAVQEKMLQKIAEQEKKNIERRHPLSWEIMHMAGSASIGHLLALKRGLDRELAAAACSVHDYGRILTGTQENHAANAYEPVKELLLETGIFSEEEIETLAQAARKHSDKDRVDSPLEEIVKDADVLDCYQYNIPIKRPEQKSRLENLKKELSLNQA